MRNGARSTSSVGEGRFTSRTLLHHRAQPDYRIVEPLLEIFSSARKLIFEKADIKVLPLSQKEIHFALLDIQLDEPLMRYLEANGNIFLKTQIKLLPLSEKRKANCKCLSTTRCEILTSRTSSCQETITIRFSKWTLFSHR